MTTAVETPATPKKRISGAWYALVAIPGIVAIAVWYTHLPKVIAGFASLGSQTFTTIVGAPPSEGGVEIFVKSEMNEVRLRAGTNTIYVEGYKDGEHTEPRTELSCVMVGPDDRSVDLRRDTSSTMTLDSSHFASQYDAQIDTAGDYRVSCFASVEAEYSISRSFPGMSILWLVLATFLALPMTGVVGYLVNRVRNPKAPKVPARVPDRAI
jgi:hypothetical protein